MSRKREEIKVLSHELDLLVRRLEQLQQRPPTSWRQAYPVANQADDLDRAIMILRSAGKRLGKEVKRVEAMTGGVVCFESDDDGQAPNGRSSESEPAN